MHSLTNLALRVVMWTSPLWGWVILRDYLISLAPAGYTEAAYFFAPMVLVGLGVAIFTVFPAHSEAVYLTAIGAVLQAVLNIYTWITVVSASFVVSTPIMLGHGHTPSPSAGLSATLPSFMAKVAAYLDPTVWSATALVGVSASIAAYVARTGRLPFGDARKMRAGAHGSARLAQLSDLRPLLEKDAGVPVGLVPVFFGLTKKVLWWNGQGAILTIAPPRRGKGRSAILPALITYGGVHREKNGRVWLGGSCVCVDPKGENALVAAVSRRLLGRKVAILNPFHIPALGRNRWRYNPLDLVRPGEYLVRDITVIAEAIVAREKDDKAHFHEGALKMVAGAIAFVIATKPGSSLVDVHRILTSRERFDEFAEAALADEKIGQGLPAIAAGVWQSVGQEERGSFFSTIARHMNFLDDPSMRDALSVSDFDILDLARGALDIFICLPHEVMSRYFRWMRLIVAAGISAVYRCPTRPEQDVLFLLDEMPALGGMPAILNPADGSGALTTGPGLGVKIWGIIQTPAQLAMCYGQEGAKAWKSSVAAMQIFGVAQTDSDFSKEVSQLLGETSVIQRSVSQGGGGAKGFSLSSSTSEAKGLVMTADEVRRLPRDQQILFIEGVGRPAIVGRADYDQRPEWRWRYARNPFVPANLLQPYALVYPSETRQ